MCLAVRASGIGTSFLTIPAYPRELALGGLTTSIAGDPSLARGNPALIVQPLPAMEVYFGYNAWFAGARGTSVLVIQPAARGTVGFGVRHMAISDLELRTERPTDEYLSHFTVSGTAVEGVWGRKFAQLQIGGTLRWIRLESYVWTSSGMAIDLGVLWPLMNKRISLGASIQNLGSMSRMFKQAPGLPTALQIGGTFDVSSLLSQEDNVYRSSMTIGAEISRAHGAVARVAGEMFLGDARITLGTRMSEKVTQVAGGVNLTWRRFQVSYGLAVGSHQLGIPHLFRVKTTLP